VSHRKKGESILTTAVLLILWFRYLSSKIPNPVLRKNRFICEPQQKKRHIIGYYTRSLFKVRLVYHIVNYSISTAVKENCSIYYSN
jgi:hypothetical protein